MNLYKKSLETLMGNILSRPFYTDKLREMVSIKNILIITGQRRTGKSMIVLDYLKKEKIDLLKVFYINKELDSLNTIPDIFSLEKLFEDSWKDKFEYIIIDEIQDIDSWEQFIRARFAEKNIK